MNGDKRRTPDQESPADRDGGAVRLDGNFAAGILSEVFVPDITTTRAMCANCETIRPLGALPVYGQNMGAVMRCPICDEVVLRVARTPRQLWLDPTEARLLLLPDATSPSVEKLSREQQETGKNTRRFALGAALLATAALTSLVPGCATTENLSSMFPV
jgi:hypothetical protein